MNKQRGITNGWLILAGVIALLVVITVAVKTWDSFVTGIEKRGYDRGTFETDAKYKTRDNQQLQAALAAQKAAEARAATAEAEAAKSQVIASTNYRKGVKDGEAKTAARIAAARAGNLQLRDPGNPTCPAAQPGSGKAETADAKPGSNDPSGGQLSGEASEFLLGLTGEADAVANQLALAQSEISTILEVCAKR